MEKWKSIQEYKGIYEASTYGRVRTSEGKTTFTQKHGIRRWKQRILKYRGTNYITGYRVSLWKDGKFKEWLVARLIAMTFLGFPKTTDTVNHIDGNRFNNNIENLEWLSLADNIRHGFKTGLYPQCATFLFSKKTKNILKFRSKAEASRFLNHNHGYICDREIKGKLDCGDYLIVGQPYGTR